MQRIDRREAAKGQTNLLANDLQYPRHRKEDLVLNQYEQMIAAEVVAPEDIAVGFEGRQTSFALGHG